MSNVSSLSSSIREEALRLGFLKVGIVPAQPLPQEEHFTTWLERGLHGEMRYMERQAQKRRNPQMVLPNAKSLLILALNYYTEDRPANTPLTGMISRYAWGDDYHAIVESRLTRLLDFIQTRDPSLQGLCYSDTGPVMEKVWGALSSLGWMGKHTNLIIRDHGSWFFVGIILLDTELEYDSQEKDFCGSCSRCIEACPTGAIIAPYVLDARLCISYLTIEYRGIIPRRLRPLMGNRIFGCDSCQEVCPWNRFAAKTAEKAFCSRESSIPADLVSLASITPGEFKDRFSKSPVLRVAYSGFIRNAVIALGNSHMKEALPTLEKALQQPNPLIRAHAAWALGQIDSSQTLRILTSIRANETDPFVQEEIAAALGETG
jgi:epoxyqueuosine reductase